MRLSSGTVRRRRLLLVDPDAVYRAGLEVPLEMALWTVFGCADVEGALAWLDAHPKHHIDAIWCETSMRDGSGQELIARVRQLRPALVGVPALIVSASEPKGCDDSVRFFHKKETAAAVRWLVLLEEPNGEAADYVPYS